MQKLLAEVAGADRYNPGTFKGAPERENITQSQIMEQNIKVRKQRDSSRESKITLTSFWILLY